MNSIIYPMFALVVLTMIVAIRLLMIRIDGVKKGLVRINYFKTYTEGGQPSEQMTAASRHFVNLFEVPVLFYVVCLLILFSNLESPKFIGLAWFFVACRCVHAFIHLTSNKVRFRMLAFLLGTATVTSMWALLVIAKLTAE